MSSEAEEKFLEICRLFERMSREICTVVQSYYVWRTLTFARSITEIGREKAEENAQIMNLYKDFFIPSEQSHLQTFIIGLMKFFDSNPRSLSIIGLMEKIEKNKDIFTADIIHRIYPNFTSMETVTNDYVPIDQETIDRITQLKKQHEPLIANLKDIRDKQFAHTDMKTINGTFVPLEVEALIKAIQEMFNELSGTFNFSSTIWDHLKEESIHSTQSLLRNLKMVESLES